jgi:hypothetical protein
MTAVEWLAEQMMHPSIHNPYIEQALEIEKKQIIDAYYEGKEYGFKEHAEQYYNEQYKK